ncbi:hypothetical protein [Pacificibacter marinus]|uniref:hypothetical protein n=1 Tax=Pacificibacter marinus TaxID=658057 RepID=UPI001C070B29|nr:hypothetical protein [Pacificibacter marinus]MBU2865605.1 hypothetical protein [Pacificibacter marinus]
MYYDTVPKSRQYISTLNVIFPFAIGFYLWQVFLGTGLVLVEMSTGQNASFGFDIFARTLIWGSPLYAFCICAIFLWGIWFASTTLNFSRNRRIKHLKLGIATFIAGFLLSLFGLLAGLSDKPPLNLVYQPMIHALDS